MQIQITEPERQMLRRLLAKEAEELHALAARSERIAWPMGVASFTEQVRVVESIQRKLGCEIFCPVGVPLSQAQAYD